MSPNQLLIGGHVSSAGGIANAPQRARAIGANCAQIFSASPRIWARSPIKATEVDQFNLNKKQFGIVRTVIHAIYLVNLASQNPELVQKSKSVIEYDLNLDAEIGGSGVVVHLGSHQGLGFEAVKKQVVRQISEILDQTPGNSTFLIENSAGQKGKLVSDLGEIKWILDQVGSTRLGWCLDTCHAHAAGYLMDIFTKIGSLQLWDSLKVVHVNDSKDPFGSGRDRHENLLDGTIGESAFSNFFSEAKIRALPLILEVPGVDGKSGPDGENIKRLERLVANAK